MKEIRIISHELKVNVSVYNTLHEAKTRLYRYFQGEEETIGNHLKNIKELISVVKHFGGEVSADKGLIRFKKARKENF